MVLDGISAALGFSALLLRRSRGEPWDVAAVFAIATAVCSAACFRFLVARLPRLIVPERMPRRDAAVFLFLMVEAMMVGAGWDTSGTLPGNELADGVLLLVIVPAVIAVVGAVVWRLPVWHRTGRGETTPRCPSCRAANIHRGQFCMYCGVHLRSPEGRSTDGGTPESI